MTANEVQIQHNNNTKPYSKKYLQLIMQFRPWRKYQACKFCQVQARVLFDISLNNKKKKILEIS